MQAVYYRDGDGVEPVNEFIDVQVGPEQVSRELRCHYGRDLYRIFYQRSGNLFVLLHAIEKRTAALPPGDIEIAKTRFEDFRKRMNTRPRRPPRAAGHDAP